MSNYRRLDVWKAAHQMTLQVYKDTTRFPSHERFGLTAQVRRAAVSIGANIAEGSARGGKDYARFLTMAIGSASEVEYLLLVATDLGYFDGRQLEADVASIARRLTRLRLKVLGSIR
jgi:four helix bundle protein